MAGWPSWTAGWFVLTLLLSVFIVYNSAAAGENTTTPRVVVLPFDMHGPGDITAERKLLMEAVASSLHREGAEIAGLEKLKTLFIEEGRKGFDEAIAMTVGKEAGADFALLGNLTLLERTFTADWRILDLRDGRIVKFYYKSAGSAEELVSKVKESASSVYSRMLAALEKREMVKTTTVEKITVEGTRRIDGEAVLKRASTRVGAEFSADSVREDVKNIYAMGWFDDVAADVRDSDTGKELTFTVMEKPYVKSITLKGWKNVKEEKIKEVMTIKENTILDHIAIKGDAERIKAVYTQSGYYLAEVSSEIITEGVEAAIVFHINEREKVRVKAITVIGNKAFSAKGIKDVMATKEAGFLSFITGSGSFDEYTFENDLSLIMKQYYDNGYVRAEILDHRALLSEDKTWFFITIAVSEGDRYRVGKLAVTGDIVTTEENLIKKLRMKSGEVFNRSKLTRGTDVLTEVYGDQGFANASFEPLTNIDADKKTIDLTIQAKKNEPVYIEKIDISGNVRTRDKVIRRELEFGEGELYSFSNLKRSRNNLKRLGYFEDVAIEKSGGSAPDKIRLDVGVKERPTGMVTFGMGYSTSDKVVTTASISQSNLMGTGLKLDLSGTVSSRSSQYVLGFTQPWLFDRPLSAGIDLFNTSKNYPDFRMKKNGFNLRFGFPLYKRVTNAYLTYRYEKADVTNIASTASATIKEQEGTSTLSAIQALVKHDTRDDAFFPREGSVITGSVEFAGGPLGATTNYVRYEGSAGRYFPLPWDTTFMVRGVAGYMQGFGGKEVPLYERYFLGGINSIRGFESRTIGPRDPITNDLIGGKSKLIINTEYMFPVFPKENIRGIVFFDMGNAYESAIQPGDLRKGAGVGIRWFSPVGPIRIEWGYNLSPRKGEKTALWEFTIGSGF